MSKLGHEGECSVIVILLCAQSVLLWCTYALCVVVRMLCNMYARDYEYAFVQRNGCHVST